MVYTGYRYEYLYNHADELNGYSDLLESTDYLVDGKFELTKKNELISFRGSENQRIIDCQRSIDSGELVTVEL
ncbi:anaerobic ribonucleotide reductase-activating protein [compost metagenome]